MSFLLIIVFTSAVFIAAGITLIGNRIVSEAQEKVRTDLNAAREIYLNHLNHVDYVIRLTADRLLLMNELMGGNKQHATDTLRKIRERENLDLLTVTDSSGKVLLRTTESGLAGDDQSSDALVRAVLDRKDVVAATAIIPMEELQKESPLLTKRAYFKFIDTPKARARSETEETAGMMLKAAAPMFDQQGNFIGVIYGGVLLNRNFVIVDKIKETVFQNIQYKGRDIGTATIFQDDVRISTNVHNQDGSRAIGTRVTEEVYRQVVKEGKPWIGRAYVVNHWYITAYEPIRNVKGDIIGILYVGLLEQKYLDIKKRAILVFSAITLLGALVAMALAWWISRRISMSVKKLALASKQVADGNLDAQVAVNSHDELHELAETFNFMATALKKRDDKLKEFTRNKIMESERLALIGQLAANVAHELNNPLQGIVTYSHLLLEKLPTHNSAKESVKKIVIQADRCTEIIRGLLDFSRQRKPHKRLCDVNSVLRDCINLVEDQALFHNIEFVKAFEENLPQVVIDPSQMQQVFMNMIINAAEAMEGSGKITIATRADSHDSVIEVLFSDTGHGISEEIVEKIFDPFFTTKEATHGTGLGLAISYGIIKEHEGTISVESGEGKGTTFILRLPITVERHEERDGQ
ncbi:MAG: cache domain-containing protein [bacterium]